MLVMVAGTVAVHGLHRRAADLLLERASLTEAAYLSALRDVTWAVLIQVVALTTALAVSSVKPCGLRRGGAAGSRPWPPTDPPR